MFEDYCYEMIASYYGDRCAERSGVRYMNHIDEGMILCDALGYDLSVKRGFCLHPIFQNDESLRWAMDEGLIEKIEPRVVVMAMEYRWVANRFLSDRIVEADDIELSVIEGVNQMLVVDKIQNRKDFELYHEGEHDRSDELRKYFCAWLSCLGISEEKYQAMKRLLMGVICIQSG